MAMIICASFYCINGGAEFRNFYQSGYTYDMFTYDDNNDSEATAYFTNWGYNEEDNDLLATTWAHAGYDNRYAAVQAAAGVSIVFDDYSTGGGETFSDVGWGETWIYSEHSGSQYDDFDHCVNGFTTSHEVYVAVNVNGELVQLGHSFYIGTSS